MALRVCQALSLVVTLIVSQMASAAPLPQAGVFTYSDQCISRGSGDTYGYRIALLRGPGGYIWALIYIDDSAPILGFAKFDPKTGAIHIEATDEAKNVTRVDGTVDTESLRRDGEPTLHRISDSETKVPYCGTTG